MHRSGIFIFGGMNQRENIVYYLNLYLKQLCNFVRATIIATNDTGGRSLIVKTAQ